MLFQNRISQTNFYNRRLIGNNFISNRLLFLSIAPFCLIAHLYQNLLRAKITPNKAIFSTFENPFLDDVIKCSAEPKRKRLKKNEENFTLFAFFTVNFSGNLQAQKHFLHNIMKFLCIL